MMTKNADKKREQMLIFCMDDMVPQNHMLRLIDKVIDWTFIYDLVKEKYSLDNWKSEYGSGISIQKPYDPSWLFSFTVHFLTYHWIGYNKLDRFFKGIYNESI